MSILPKEILQHIHRIHIVTKRAVTDKFAGEYLSIFKGRGMEFEEIREYSPGDEIKNIDWNVTARMNFPYIKNFCEEREMTIMILVDLSQSTLFGTEGKTKKTIITEIVALLSLLAAKNNDKVGLIIFTDVIEKYLPPKKGTKHVMRTLRELFACKPTHSGTDIAQALSFLHKVQKHKGICFVISDFFATPCNKEWTITAKKHDLTALCLSDPREQEIPNIGMVTLRDLENGNDITIDTSIQQTRNALTTYHSTRIREYESLMHRINAGFIQLSSHTSSIDSIRDYFIKREMGLQR